MWHQFYELAGVDITKEPMEVGATCHYVMGGVEVDPDTAAAIGVPGLYAAGEVAGGIIIFLLFFKFEAKKLLKNNF